MNVAGWRENKRLSFNLFVNNTIVECIWVIHIDLPGGPPPTGIITHLTQIVLTQYINKASPLFFERIHLLCICVIKIKKTVKEPNNSLLKHLLCHLQGNPASRNFESSLISCCGLYEYVSFVYRLCPCTRTSIYRKRQPPMASIFYV